MTNPLRIGERAGFKASYLSECQLDVQIRRLGVVRELTRREHNERRSIPFSVDGHLLRELGERLVSRPSIALAELVKNSYDADATQVTLKFHDTKTIGGTIVVEDNGHGMSIDDVERTWMCVATRDKRKNPLSPKYKRGRAGEKGIGRFACQLIADELVLESICRTKRGKEKLSARFKWQKYWSHRKLSETRINFDVARVPDDNEIGTRLTLRNTRQAWTKNDIAEMRRDILSLINPFSWESTMKAGDSDEKADPGFSVSFKVPDYPEFEGKLSEYYLEAAWCRLDGRLTKGGEATYTVKVRKGPKRRFNVPGKKYPDVGPTRFIIYFFRTRGEKYEEFGFSASDVRKAGKEHGGVRIYLDNFRVFPYGEAGVDWLKIDKDRGRRIEKAPEILKRRTKGVYRPMLHLPGNESLVGAVFVTRKENLNIVLSVTRDRLVENDAFEQLTNFVRLGIDFMTVVYASESEGRRSQARETRREKESKQTLQEIRQVIKEIVESSEPEEKLETLVVLHDLSQDLEEQLIEEEEEIIALIDMYQVLASTGTLVGVLGHELVALKQAIGHSTTRISEIGKSVPRNPRGELARVCKSLARWEKFLDELSGTIGQMLSRDSRDQRVRLAVSEAIDDVVSAFKEYCDLFDIDLTNSVPYTLTTPPMFLAQLYSIVVNLLTNAIKWVRFRDDRRIRFEGRTTDDGIEFWILDSGPGVPEDIREEVFRPFVSYSTPDLRLGTGTGLGLTIVKDFVGDNNGDVGFIDPPDGWGTCCRIRFEG